MGMDFHDQKNSHSYATRSADSQWKRQLESILDVKGKKILDIGCGGGIYSKALAELGAVSVTGIDFSQKMLSVAKQNCKDYRNITFRTGRAERTEMKPLEYDIILERAVIHHLDELRSNFNEAFRVLKPNGVFIIQDRTPDDCLLDGTNEHIRGYFFEKFPKLIQKEINRRHESPLVMAELKEAGFVVITENKFWETRKEYTTFKQLEMDLLKRTGRSILHELSDNELNELIKFIEEKLKFRSGSKITEKDRWTIWVATKRENYVGE
ncbi:class I SAM-dependent methyltransferase [Bacillus carboniphilus]|uniref:Class I SAM-dependent methyltransferase n=1 Tax=Bacillus carboniphilus TaxID=86663 RepID=A0ABN0W9C4_9BACI